MHVAVARTHTHTHTKCIILWPHWLKTWCRSADTSFCCILGATAMLLLMRHAASHEATATSALSSSGMRGGSAALPGQGTFLWGESYGEWEGQTQSQQLEKRGQIIASSAIHANHPPFFRISHGCKMLQKREKSPPKSSVDFESSHFKGLEREIMNKCTC